MAEKLKVSTADPISQAKVWLVLHQPFFAHIVLEQSCVPEPEGTSTLSTDGKAIYYNPEFVSELSVEELAGAICHELMHNLLFHLARRQGRVIEIWNLATDIAVNNDLLEAGLRLPKGSISHLTFKGMNAEKIYSALHEEHKPTVGGPAGLEEGGGAEDELARIIACYGAKKEDLSEAHNRWESACEDIPENIWTARLFQGLTAAGKLEGGGGVPGGCVRMAKTLVSPKVSWRERLAQILSFYLKPNDFDPARPNLKYLSQGIHLPALKSETSHNVIAALDTSASINRKALGSFLGELLELLKEVDDVKAVTFDTELYEFDPFSKQVSDLNFSEPALKGGGGTDFRSVFRHIEETCLFPDIVVIFTDLNGRFPDFFPSYPVLWVTPIEMVKPPPFGEVLVLPHKEMVP